MDLKAIQQGFKRGGITDPNAVPQFLEGLLQMGKNLGYSNPVIFREQALNLMKLESGYNPKITNSLGYKGFIQFSPSAQKTYAYDPNSITSQLSAIEKYLRNNQATMYKIHGEEVVNRDKTEDGSLLLTSIFTGPAAKGLKDPIKAGAKDAYGTSVPTYYKNITNIPKELRESTLVKEAKENTPQPQQTTQPQQEFKFAIADDAIKQFAEYYKQQEQNKLPQQQGQTEAKILSQKIPQSIPQPIYREPEVEDLNNQLGLDNYTPASNIGYEGNQGYQGYEGQQVAQQEAQLPQIYQDQGAQINIDPLLGFYQNQQQQANQQIRSGSLELPTLQGLPNLPKLS